MKIARWLPLLLLCASSAGCGPQLEEPAPKPFRYARLGVTECSGPGSDIVKVGFAGRTVQLPCSTAMQSAIPVADGGYDGIGMGLYYSVQQGIGAPETTKGPLYAAQTFLIGGVSGWNDVVERNWLRKRNLLKDIIWVSKDGAGTSLLREQSSKQNVLENRRIVGRRTLRIAFTCNYYDNKTEELIRVLERRTNGSGSRVYCYIDGVVEGRMTMHFKTGGGELILSDPERFFAEFARFLRPSE